MSSVLGISGFAGSGKDTIANHLIEKHGWSGKLSFARNLKDMVKYVFKLSEYQVSDHDGKKQDLGEVVLTTSQLGGILTWMCRTHDASGLAGRKAEIKQFLADSVGRKFSTPREIMQFVGTDVCRNIIPTYHIDIIQKLVQQIEGNWIITDVRFINEAEMLQSLNGVLIRVERPDLSLTEVYRHSSETALNDWNQWNSVILNDTPNVEDLYTKVDKFLEENQLCRKIIL